MKKTLTEMRTERGLIQSDLGSRALITQIENGKRLPGPRALKAMAKVLGVAPLVAMDACRACATKPSNRFSRKATAK